MRLAIVGGSLTGLAVGNVLRRLGIEFVIYEKFDSSFEKRGSSLGYVDVPLWEEIRGVPMMRLGRRASRQQGAFFYGDLWKFLYDGLPPNSIRYNTTVTDLGSDINRPTIEGASYDAVIIADGGWSSLRRYVNGEDKQPTYAGYVTFRARVEASKMTPSFTSEGAYESGKFFAIALSVPTCDQRHFWMGGVAVAMPESAELVASRRPVSGASRHAEATNSEAPSWFLPFVRRNFAHAASGELVRWIESCAAHGKITPQPQYEFKADRVTAGRLIVMGDAAHMASPRTAVGAHTGILDAAGLFDALQAYPGVDQLDAAIQAYSAGGVQRAHQLYMRSKEVSAPIAWKAGDDFMAGLL